MGGLVPAWGHEMGALDGRKATILVADDAAEVRTLVRITLQSQGWTVLEASATVAAFDLAQHARPDAVLLDVVFEGEADDGFEVCRRLRKTSATATIPVVMLAARSTAADLAVAQSAGATAYLPKPFGPIELIATLRSVLGLSGPAPALGLLLVDEGRLRPDQLEVALEQQERFRAVGIQTPIGEVLVREGSVKSTDIDRALQRQRASPAFSERAPRRVRVLVVDEHLSIREGVRAMLVKEDGFEIVGIAGDGEAALRLMRQSRPDVAILDQDLRGHTGLELLELMREENLPTAAIIYSFDAGVRDSALAAGAAFVNKDAHPAALAAAVVRAGGGTVRPGSRRTLTAAREASKVAVRAMVRQRRASGVIGVLAVAYAGSFLVAEPLLGAGAALLAIAPVAIAGALLGPELGVLAAILAGVESQALWSGTGHSLGEPVLVVGGNGVALLALMGIGAGFGAMRLLRGYFNRRDRLVDALVRSGLLLGVGGPETLALVTEAAREIVAADAVLTYGPAEGGMLQVVAGAGAPRSFIGQREAGPFGPVHRVYAEAWPRVLDEREARAFMPAMRSGIVVPACPVGERPRGVLVALSGRRGQKMDGTDAAALLRFAPSVWLALKLAAEQGWRERGEFAAPVGPSRDRALSRHLRRWLRSRKGRLSPAEKVATCAEERS